MIDLVRIHTTEFIGDEFRQDFNNTNDFSAVSMSIVSDISLCDGKYRVRVDTIPMMYSLVSRISVIGFRSPVSIEIGEGISIVVSEGDRENIHRPVEMRHADNVVGTFEFTTAELIIMLSSAIFNIAKSLDRIDVKIEDLIETYPPEVFGWMVAGRSENRNGDTHF